MPAEKAANRGDRVHAPLDVNDAKGVSKALVPYRRAKPLRGVFEVLVTAAPLIAIWALACVALHFRIWWGLVLVAPAAAFLVRLFMIQHDCGHGSFFPDKHANDWLGRVIGVLTLTPYDYWRQSHAVHHASSGALDNRSLGGVETLTVEEYAALSWKRRLGYRLYRHPLVMFGLGPTYLFLLQQRLPVGLMRGGWRPWLSTMGTNLAIAAIAGGTLWLMGWRAFLLVNVPIVVLAGTIGIWLFYVQHQFEETHWSRDGEWDLRDAALRGSSHYDLPPIVRWFTGNIGVHHVHHLSSRIPFYRLREVLKDFPQLKAVGRITFWQSLRCINLSLWDEANQRLVSFKQYRKAKARSLAMGISPA
jgi:omega-6 fatty acid desaturase (delta-12 desaturase)